MKKFASFICKFTICISALTAVLTALMFDADTIEFGNALIIGAICITGVIVSFAVLYEIEGGDINGKNSNL